MKNKNKYRKINVLFMFDFLCFHLCYVKKILAPYFQGFPISISGSIPKNIF